MCTDEEGISHLLVSYYQYLFTTSNLSKMEEVMVGVPCFVTEEMNNVLLGEYSKDEVVTTLT